MSAAYIQAIPADEIWCIKRLQATKYKVIHAINLFDL